MSVFTAELVGTAVLILLGNGVVANVLLGRTKGAGGGWIVIASGWGMAVFVAVLCVAEISGAHINPAVTVCLAAAGELSAGEVVIYLTAQMLGAMLGAVLVYLFYYDHYRVTEDADAKLATFCTSPQLRHPIRNCFSELIATFVLTYGVLMAADPAITSDYPSGPLVPEAKLGLGALGALPVGLIVVAIGLSLGGTTGYAINPARDLGPRIVHALLPIAGKRDSDWGYAWIPVLGPVLGGLLAALLYRLLGSA